MFLQLSKKYSGLGSNLTYITVFQGLNIVIPLISYPYLLRVLGKESYGLIIFAQSIVSYLLILVSFGFNISAAKLISVNRDSKPEVARIVTGVFIIKLALLSIVTAILFFVLRAIEASENIRDLYCLSMWICVYDIVLPIWYYQGIEKMKYITFLTLVSRLIFLGFVFVLVNSADDMLMVPLLNGIGAMVAGIASLYIMFKMHRVSFILPSKQELKFYFKESLPLFVSNLSVKVYASTNKVILGSVLGMSEVAYYDLAEKITNALKIPQVIINQALFPRISRLRSKRLNQLTLKYSFITSFALTAVIFYFSQSLIIMMGGTQMLEAIVVLKILLISVPIIAISNNYGIHYLVAYGYNKTFSYVIIASGIIYLTLLSVLYTFSQISLIQISVITLITEFVVMLLMYQNCQKRKLL